MELQEATELKSRDDEGLRDPFCCPVFNGYSCSASKVFSELPWYLRQE